MFCFLRFKIYSVISYSYSLHDFALARGCSHWIQESIAATQIRRHRSIIDMISNNVLEEDSKPIMWYDHVLTRMGRG